LTDEKPEEAAVINEKIVTLTELWQELKQTVRESTTVTCSSVVKYHVTVFSASCGSRGCK